MTERTTPQKPSGLDELREELADQFIQVAVRERQPRKGRRVRRRGIAVLGVAVLLVPASLAGAGVFDGDHTVEWDGENVKMDGEVVECPVDDAVEDELGFSPCEIWAPAPAPASEEPGGLDQPPRSGSSGDSTTPAPAPLAPRR